MYDIRDDFKLKKPFRPHGLYKKYFSVVRIRIDSTISLTFKIVSEHGILDYIQTDK